MKFKISIFYLFLLSCFTISLQSAASSVDSIGVKTIEGKKYIIHKLEAKETLYSLGRRYHVSVAEIQKVNPKEKDGYKITQIGRELLIPYKEEEFIQSKSNEGNPALVAEKSDPKKHIVKAGETLYSLAKQYNVSQDKIKKWNNLESNNLSIDQELWVSNPKKTPNIKNKEDKKGESAGLEGEITHVVDLGETIYSISKRYEVPQSDIIKWNELKDNNIAVGQKLIIKKVDSDDNEEVSEKETIPMQTPSVQTFHNAKKGETYEEVASMYGLKLANLKSWNKFKAPFVGGEVITIVPPSIEEEKSVANDNNRNEQQEEVDESKIHTVKSGETLYSLSEKYDVEVEDLRKWNSLNNYQLSNGQKLYIQNPDALSSSSLPETEKIDAQEKAKPSVSDNPQKKDTKAFFTVDEDDMPKLNKIKEIGIAEVIEGSEGTEKYLALHRTAKIGTIMQVRNDLNDQIVFVRVLGKLPNTGVDQKVIIKISKKAFEKLGGVDYKFPVEISYLPLKD
jgi:LysM repeat protein